MLIALVAAVGLSACTIGEDVGANLAQARAFDEYPLYWAGERFEDWDLAHVRTDYGQFSTFVYGTCKTSGSEGGCPPPLQIQIAPLCYHLDVIAHNPSWKTRRIRGAPVGTNPDGAPVLFSRRAQIKVYRGQGSQRGDDLRLMHALRSLNGVEPQFGPDDPIPPPAPGVLEGTAPCR